MVDQHGQKIKAPRVAPFWVGWLTETRQVNWYDLARRFLHGILYAEKLPAAVICRVGVEGKRHDVPAIVAVLVLVVIAELLAHSAVEALRLADGDLRHAECGARHPHACFVRTTHHDHNLI